MNIRAERGIRRAVLAAALLAGVAMPAADSFAAGPAPSAGREDLQLTLPPEIQAAPGVEMAVYFDNIVCTRTPENYRFTVACALGKTEARRWAVTPKAGDEGRHPLTVEVRDASGGALLGKATTVLAVAARKPGNLKHVRLLLVGDSLTAAGVYPVELARLLDGPAQPAWEMLGGLRGAGKTAHEGRGGWTWEAYVNRLRPPTNTVPRDGSSPFVVAGADGKPVLDVPRYLRETCGGRAPDVITFLLGINDCFGAGKNPDDPKLMERTLDAMFANAEILLKAFREAAPHATIGVCLAPPPNSREEAFVANYKGNYHRWEWKRVQHALVRRQIERFGGREKENIHLVPTGPNLDVVDGYPPNNAVHPNAAGYAQIAASLHAWLMTRLQATPAVRAGVPNVRPQP